MNALDDGHAPLRRALAPGSWAREPWSTSRGPRSGANWVDTHPEPFQKGTADMCRYYGLLLRSARVRSYAERLRLQRQGNRRRRRRSLERFARGERGYSRNKVWREHLREWDE